MPLYPFVCKACETEFEQFSARATTTLVAECPTCGSEKTERKLGIPAKGQVLSGLTVNPGTCGVGPPCGAAGCRRIPPS